MNHKECGRKWWKPRGSALGRLRKTHNKFKSGWLNKWMKTRTGSWSLFRDTAACQSDAILSKEFTAFRYRQVAHMVQFWSVSKISRQNLHCTAANAYGRCS